ncbi:MAG: GntT/GntP/DsdX family permease, partial [Arthrobacter sp.]
MRALTASLAILADSTTDKIHDPWTAHDTQVLIVAALGIALVVVLIIWAKFHAFLALTISSLLVGVFSGISLPDVTKSYENGVGGVLGYVGVLIALGAMLGKLLGDSGGADKIVDTLLHGRAATLPWKMALIAGIIGIPMFFEVGLVLLVPVVMLAVHRSRGPSMLLAIPALAGLSVLHGFIPPHPGPVAAIGLLHADIGITLALGLLIAIPVVAVCGPIFSHLAARWVPIGAAGAGLSFVGEAAGSTTPESYTPAAGNGQQATATLKQATHQQQEPGSAVSQRSARDPEATRSPSFGWTLTTVLSPVALMLLRAAADLWVDPHSALYNALSILGDPVVALLIAVLLAMVTFGTAVGFSASTLGKKIGASLLPSVGV